MIKMVNEHNICGVGLRQDNLSAACRKGIHRSCMSLKCKCPCGHSPAAEIKNTSLAQGGKKVSPK